MKLIALLLTVLALVSCEAIKPVVQEVEEWDTVYQAKQGCVWTQVNDST